MARRIKVLSTGGTISSKGMPGLAEPTSGAKELLDDVEQLPDDIEVIDLVDVKQVISPALSLADMWDITDAIDQHSANCDGIVVTHGTATVIDTAFVSLARGAGSGPVSFTGAMATANRNSRDGPRNIRDAILAAARFQDVGTMLVANGLVHNPRFVKKTHKSAFDAFTSGQYGTIGYIDDDVATITARPTPLPHLRLARPDDSAVQVVKAVAGMNDVLLSAALDSGAEGIVIDTLPGRGGIPPKLEERLTEALESGLPIVLAGEGDGRIKGNYSGPAHASFYLQRGAIAGGDLSVSRCRILLSMLLAGGTRTDEILDVFGTVAP